ncbi:hypothetical protein AB0454_23050 [Streptomyces sp. NPDC093509]|uniref:hypothetical protein n=1 Tax=Streptomyces sp. NPDC093509 TaxID=3154982 RepID=UPI00344BB988
MTRTPTRRTRTRASALHLLNRPLARWGFTALAVLALMSDQVWPFVITTALAAYGWRTQPRRRTRR